MKAALAGAGARGAKRRARAASALMVGLSLVPREVARADSKQECSEAYYATQVLRDEGKLDEALIAVKLCVSDACAPFIRDDCGSWQRDLEARLAALAASVVVLAVDASGAPLSDVAVTLDGKPWLSRIDGAARALPPGTHILEGRLAGATPQTRSVTLAEGEKNRRVTLAFDVEGPASRGGAGPGPWILGGAGVAALVAGAITGGLVVDAYEVTQDECDDASRTCSQAGLDAQERGRTLGPTTTGLLVGGGAMVAGAATWLLVIALRPTPSVPAALWVTPTLDPQRAGLLLGWRW